MPPLIPRLRALARLRRMRRGAGASRRPARLHRPRSAGRSRRGSLRARIARIAWRPVHRPARTRRRAEARSPQRFDRHHDTAFVVLGEGRDGALEFAFRNAGDGLGYQHMALAADFEDGAELSDWLWRPLRQPIRRCGSISRSIFGKNVRDGLQRPVRARAVRHRTDAYLNNRLEQDHRGVKDRYRPMRRLQELPVGGAILSCLRRSPGLPARPRRSLPTFAGRSQATAPSPPRRHGPRNPPISLTSARAA
jgi:hypothetical protein